MRNIGENLYLLELELPNSPLKAINCYFIKGQDRHLLIDTAFNHDNCEQSLLAQFDELGVALEDTDIFLTHMHVDHSGLIDRLKRPQNTVYAHEKDKVLIDGFQNPQHWNWITDNNRLTATPDAIRPMTSMPASTRCWSISRPLLEAPSQQRWFACSETLAQLQDLCFVSRAKCDSRGGALYFSLESECVVDVEDRLSICTNNKDSSKSS